MSHYKPYPAYKDSGVEWLGQMPEHWVQVPLKRLVRSIEQGWSPECKSWPADNGAWGVVKVGCVNGGRFRPEENKALPASLEPRPELGLREGDVLVSRANTRELVGSYVAVPQSYPNLLLCDKIYRIRCGELVTPSFLAALITVHGRRAVEIEANGASASMVNIAQSVILDLPVALPGSSEQSEIMEAIDHETARIDTLVAKKTRFIELLREKRQALITHAVTKGLDPNVKMKDSGVEWLGEVPEHWETMRAAAMFREVVRPGMADLPVLSISIHSGVSDDELSAEERDRKVSLIEDREKYKRVCPGDLAYNMMRAWQGAFGAVAVEGLVSPAYVVAEPRAKLCTEYVELLLRTPMAVEEMRRFSRGITDFRLRMYWEAFRDVVLLLPPYEEQLAIVAMAKREGERIDALVGKTERSIELLKEHRTALITAAVTGQIDLREHH